MPPAVAHAPIVTSLLRGASHRRWMRSASVRVVIEPSTSERSYGPRTVALEASRKYAISISPASAEQLVLAVEQRELAAVARRELPHRELRLAAHSSSPRAAARSRRSGSTGPSRQIRVGPNWQWPQCATAQRMFRSIETKILLRSTPASTSVCAVTRIITSGPQTNAYVPEDPTAARGMSFVTTPTDPVPVGVACVDGDVDVEVEPATPALELAPVKQVGRGAPAVEER